MNPTSEIMLDIMAQDILDTRAMQKKHGALFITKEAYNYLNEKLGPGAAINKIFFGSFVTLGCAKVAVEWIRRNFPGDVRPS